jgi:hypothetical protein
MPSLKKEGGGPKRRFTVKELYVSDASLHCYGLSIWVWLRLEIKHNHYSILTKCCVSYQFREDVQTCGHWPQYTADSVATKATMSPQKCHIVAAWMIRQMKSSSVSTSYRHLQWSLDWTGQTTGLVSHVTGPHTNGFFVWGHIKALIYTPPVDSEEDLIIRIFEVAANIRQQPGTFESQVSLCCVTVFCVSRSVSVRSNIRSKNVRNTTFFFLNTWVVLFDFQP